MSLIYAIYLFIMTLVLLNVIFRIQHGNWKVVMSIKTLTSRLLLHHISSLSLCIVYEYRASMRLEEIRNSDQDTFELISHFKQAPI